MLPPSKVLSLLMILLATSGATLAAQGEVVVYASVDDVFARPIAEQFTANTGITVKLVPDTEETKSTGLLNRAIAEKKPATGRCILEWGSCPCRNPQAEGRIRPVSIAQCW